MLKVINKKLKIKVKRIRQPQIYCDTPWWLLVSSSLASTRNSTSHSMQRCELRFSSAGSWGGWPVLSTTATIIQSLLCQWCCIIVVLYIIPLCLFRKVFFPFGNGDERIVGFSIVGKMAILATMSSLFTDGQQRWYLPVSHPVLKSGCSQNMPKSAPGLIVDIYPTG